MESRQFSGKTVEEAIQRALRELGARREEVEITVLRKGKPGIFGLGGEEALVSISFPGGETGPAAQARELLEGILRLLGLSARVHLTQPPEGLGLSPGMIALDIRGRDLGILIGRQGQALASLQYLANLMLSRQLKSQVPVMVDVEGYKRRRYQSLRELAQRLADQVRRTEAPATLEPMPAFERRVVHLALSSYPDIVTESVGIGAARKVVIRLRREEEPLTPPQRLAMGEEPQEEEG